MISRERLNVERCCESALNGTFTAPGMCPSANSSGGRTSSTVTLPARRRRITSSRDTGSSEVAAIEVAAQHACNFGNIALRDPPQRGQEIDHTLVGEPVKHELAVAAGRDKPRPPQMLKMLRSVCDRQPSSSREDFDVALALRELLDQLESRWACPSVFATMANCSNSACFGPRVVIGVPS